jgi:hypothetical protein
MLFRVLFFSCLCVSAATSKPSLAALCSSGAGPVAGGSGSFTVLSSATFLALIYLLKLFLIKNNCGEILISQLGDILTGKFCDFKGFFRHFLE